MSLLLTLFLYVCVCDRGIIAVVVCGDEVTAPTYFSVFKQIHSSNTKAAKDSSEFPNFFFLMSVFILETLRAFCFLRHSKERTLSGKNCTVHEAETSSYEKYTQRLEPDQRK